MTDHSQLNSLWFEAVEKGSVTATFPSERAAISARFKLYKGRMQIIQDLINNGGEDVYSQFSIYISGPRLTIKIDDSLQYKLDPTDLDLG